MGIAILHSYDFLQGRFRNDALAFASPSVRSQANSSNPNPNFNSYRNRRRRRSPVATNHLDRGRGRSRSGDRSAKSLATTNLVIGQVKILKRGDKLSLENSHRGLAVPAQNRVKNVKDFDLLLDSADRLGSDPATVQKQSRVSDPKEGIYAGSAFVTSPPPSSVPVPGFLGRNGAATSDLRRLLRLD